MTNRVQKNSKEIRTAHKKAPSRLCPVSAALLSVFALGPVWADEAAQAKPIQVAAVEFNQDFLNGPNSPAASKLDISRFNKGNVALPGDYRAALYVNQMWIGVVEVPLRELQKGSGNVQPCFSRDLLERMGVDLNRLSPIAQAKLQAQAGASCLVLPDLVDGAFATFDNGEQRLDASVPQAFLNRSARGYVDPQYWDDGIPAATLQYNANVFHSAGDNNASSTQSYLGLNAGLNAGPWRLRYNGNVTHNTGGDTHYQSIQSYAQRGFADIKSQLTVGDSFTDGSVFDSFGVRGIQLASDDRMYPESQRGYAPTVRGIANSNAKVQIRQNGNIIYETTVAAGPFEINDLYPTGYGGNLDVIVTEADGSQHVSSVPYASPVNALRPGITRYSASVGQYRNTSIRSTPFVFETNAQHGFSNLFTGYGGTIVAEDYVSAALGVALNTEYGAFGLDITQASASFRNQPDHNGQSVRLAYSRLFSPTNTNLTLAAYRYSTSGFLSYTDAMTLRDLDDRNLGNFMAGIQKGRLQLTLNQSLEKWGSVYLSGYTQDYWNKSNRDTQFQAGYNVSVGRVGVGVSAAREFDVSTARWNNRYMLNLSLPLGNGAYAPSSNTTYTHDTRDGSNQLQENISGALGTDREFNYGINASRTSGGMADSSNTFGGNVGYLSPVAQLRASASRSNGYTQTSAGMSGGIVAWQGGVAVTPNTGDTMAIIDAKDAAGARVATAPGVRVDPWGHALVSNLTPFSMNNVELDPKGLPMGVQLKTTEMHVAPTAGAVVKLKFDTVNAGKALIIRTKRANGEALPFGAEVLDSAGNNVGSVAQGGRIMTYGLKQDQGELTVKWGEGKGNSCSLGYSIPKDGEGKQAPYYFTDGECR
ncbi:fimbria/pilus outer membrane usher protein [Silvimonas soli]|uniref:fimbria/pilus outer membrane usher protein n=1 Tax=Silvimonas soli TaxID=2980100 RepID=UPI0024B32C1B|nr:fimbria/pilus outer membrane usher protein [Silvimonas soli]